MSTLAGQSAADEFDREAYNRDAIEMAERIADARAAFRPPGDADIPARKVFPPYNRSGLGLALEYERMGRQPVSDGLRDRAERLGFSFEHLGLTIGSIIRGPDLRADLSAEVVAFIRDALLERKVVFFRDQHLTDEQQARFGRCFGDLDAFPFNDGGDDPYVTTIHHTKNFPGTENGWHTDVTWMERPSLGSVAQVLEPPAYGGDTLFSDSYAAYLGLPDDLQERLQHVDGVNDYRYFLGMGRRRLPEQLIEDLKARFPFGVSHPIFRTHPETGRTALYLNAAFLREDSLFDRRTGEPLGAEESSRIVAVLVQQHARPEYQCRFSWEPGSVAFWDNRAVQHYAVSDYYPHERVLRRVTVSGDRPYYDPEARGR